MSQPKRYTVTIPAEVWEMSMRDAEKLAQVHKECVRMHEENEVLRKKLEFLRQAEHLVIWDGSAWKVRPEHGGKPL